MAINSFSSTNEINLIFNNIYYKLIDTEYVESTYVDISKILNSSSTVVLTNWVGI